MDPATEAQIEEQVRAVRSHALEGVPCPPRLGRGRPPAPAARCPFPPGPLDAVAVPDAARPSRRRRLDTRCSSRPCSRIRFPAVRRHALHALSCERCKEAQLCVDIEPLLERCAATDDNAKVRTQAEGDPRRLRGPAADASGCTDAADRFDRMDLDTALTFTGKHKQGVLTTIRRDGRPQLSNILYRVDGDGVIHISATDRPGQVEEPPAGQPGVALRAGRGLLVLRRRRRACGGQPGGERCRTTRSWNAGRALPGPGRRAPRLGRVPPGPSTRAACSSPSPDHSYGMITS